MELLNVIAAGIAGFAVGAAWYMGLSKQWIAASGIRVGPDGKPAGGGSMLPFVVSGIAMIVVAGFMRHIFAMSGIDSPGKGLLSGLGVGAFFVTPWVAMNYAYAARKPMLTVLDNGYAILGCGAIGLVLGLF